MNESKMKLFAVFTLFLLFLSMSSVAAQYNTQVTSDIVFSSDGTFTFTDGLGVKYELQGIPGATGTVTTGVYTANPQPTAKIPVGVSLTRFVVITFDMNAADFIRAVITIPYSDSDVSGVQAPFSIFKYMSDTDSYVELASTTDTSARTFTVILSSLDDPLFAIGGASTATGTPDSTSWIIIGVAVIAIVVLVVFIVSVLRKDK